MTLRRALGPVAVVALVLGLLALLLVPSRVTPNEEIIGLLMVACIGILLFVVRSPEPLTRPAARTTSRQ